MNCASQPYHVPALLAHTIDLLKINPDGVYVDCTFGGGGHSKAILEHLGPDGRLFGFDRDLDALQNAPVGDPRFTFVHGDFRFIKNYLEYYGVDHVDGILADLGVSFHHFDTPERGFSFRAEGPLDMRMNQSGETTAEKIINGKSEEELREILHKHTDLRNTAAIAKAICIARRNEEIKTTTRLAEIVEPLVNKKYLKKELAQVFQAIRIATNDEMGALRKLLESASSILKLKGRMAVLTYHSGEDRIVKDFFKTGSFNPIPDREQLIYGKTQSPWKLITGSPVVASEEEIEINPRARSAKLRVAELMKPCKK